MLGAYARDYANKDVFGISEQKAHKSAKEMMNWMV
jgi:hypothetical protein